MKDLGDGRMNTSLCDAIARRGRGLAWSIGFVRIDTPSIALEESVELAAMQAAKRRGLSLSAWLKEACEHALAIEDGLAAVAEYEAEHGPFSAEALAAADAMLDADGIGVIR